MSHILEEYAKSCGVKIGKPTFKPLFYPIEFDKYIVLNHSTCNATTYDRWDLVLKILNPFLKERNIKIIQILENDSSKIPNLDKYIQCSKKQAAFILSKSLCFVGVDSILTNIAGELNVPFISLYSHTNPANTKPLTHNKKSVFLSSLKENTKPSYDPNENPKTINNILPETIAQNILNLLKIKDKLKFKTIFIGERYNHDLIDVIPKEHCYIQHKSINVRMDLLHNEEVLKNILSNNFVELSLCKPVSEEILLTNKIRVINYITEEFDKDFVEKIKSLGIQLNLLCTSEEKLSEQRFKFFDYNVFLYDLKSILRNNIEKLKDSFDLNLKTFSNKKIIIGEKQYSSYLEATNSRELFFLDLDWLLVYTDDV